MTSPKIISVVRDYAMYRQCIADNPCCSGCELKAIDNRKCNESISVLYNRELAALENVKSRWLVFCHEDFKPLENLGSWLDRADKRKLYGPIGGSLVPRRRWLLGGIWGGVFCGEIIESDKDGTGAISRGRAVALDTEVETVDCQCLIVHSSLISEYGLKFDEGLSFDFYAEDFCLFARLNYGLQTAILPFRCQHFSRGKILPRFFEQKAYLDRKYPRAEAFGSSGYIIGGGRTIMRRFQKRVRIWLDRHAGVVVKWYFKLIG